MSDSSRFQNCDDELKTLFTSAAGADATAISALARILGEAEPALCEEWQPDVTAFWLTGLIDFANNVSNAGALTAESTALVRSMLFAGLDSAIFRSLYSMLAAKQFSDYADQKGLISALGVNQEDVRLAHIADKWLVMEQVTIPNCLCFERSLGVGEVQNLDNTANTVRIVSGDTSDSRKSINDKRRHTISLRSFLENAIAVKHDSIVEKWLRKEERPSKMPAAELEKQVRSCVVAACNLPMNLTRALLVPRILTDTTLKNLTTITPADDAKKVEEVAQSNSWEQSRSIQELAERLKNATTFTCNDTTELDNVAKILTDVAGREEYAGLFAFALSVLQEHSANFTDWLDALISKLADQAIIWNNNELFAENTDKLPGKQVLPWFQATRAAKGSAYLVERTFTLPYRLWTNTQRLLAGTPDKDMLHDMADAKLREGKVSADMLFWVWKTDFTDLKQTYLTNSPLLFKTLLKEVKGSYLKAQRDLHRMLLSEEKFQRQLMNGGDTSAIASLVRCAKSMTLLDAGERQSLLVQIVRLYPEALSLVEEKRSTQARSILPRITSIRSLKAREQELEYLINVQIPENTKAIEIAREHGDLRENSEFKFAKERQRFLNNRRTEYEKSLLDIRATDFRSVEVNNNVVPGCTVILKNETTGAEELFHILGIMDTMPEKSIISFETPLGKVLIGHKTGDHVDLPNGQKAIIREIKKLSNDLLDWLSSDPDPITE